MGLQCLLLMSSRTSSLASLRASFFVVLLAVWVPTAFEMTSRQGRGLQIARALANPGAPKNCLFAMIFPVCAIPMVVNCTARASNVRKRSQRTPTEVRVSVAPKPLLFNLQLSRIWCKVAELNTRQCQLIHGMVKELVKVSVGQVPVLKPLASAVYKRQRKQQTGLSRGIGLPQRSNSRLSATSVANR